MLFLAGLMGLMAVGAASFVGIMDTDSEGEQTSGDTLPGEDSDGFDQPDIDPDAPDLLQFALGGAETSGQIISGDGDDNALDGDAGDDQINGYDGDDTIDGGAGRDDLHGATGDDTLSGGADDDTMHGEDGNDSMSGGADDDMMFGHNDNDTVTGGDGNDTLQGSAGDDNLDGQAGDDAVHGGLDNDTLAGGLGNDSLFGGWGDDNLTGVVDDPDTAGTTDQDGRDYLNGGGGDDIITAGAHDIVTTGAGADTVFLGDWISEDTAAEVMDYNGAEDQLIMVWDQIDEPDPEIEVLADDADPNTSLVVVNGTTIATVHGGTNLTAGDIALISRADAEALGLRIG
jgi:Ca2+-binding RTX toxin-like protein